MSRLSEGLQNHFSFHSYIKVLATIFLLVGFAFANGVEESSSREPSAKTLILIIATDDIPAYKELQKIWLVYMNSDPEHYEAYFLKADPNLNTPYVINKNEIILKTQEGLVPGIIHKTLLALEVLQPRLHEFDYVIRTCLSSFYPYQNLTKYLSKLPKENCYCGISLYQTKNLGLPPELDNVPFVSGAGIILSRDLAQMMARDHAELEKYKILMPDDVFIGLFFQHKGIPFISAQRWDYPTHAGWLEHNHKIEDHAYHFRAKRSYQIRSEEDPYADEILTLKALLKRYYPKNSISR